eukprot:Skav224600  [mRNA]  locus=scaffold2684:320215:322053:- [translate_table: standard]
MHSRRSHAEAAADASSNGEEGSCSAETVEVVNLEVAEPGPVGHQPPGVIFSKAQVEELIPKIRYSNARPGFIGALPQLGTDEAYHLHVGSDATRLAAPTLHGLRRGLETLLQVAESWRC